MKNKKAGTKRRTAADLLLPAIHFVDPYLHHPTNPVTVNLIGAGGTGSHVLPALAAIHADLLGFDHPGLQVNVFDEDTVTPFNVGRQGFSQAEIGINKAVAIVSRVNRFYGTNWKPVKTRWSLPHKEQLSSLIAANLTISCVDTAHARFEIAELLKTAVGSTHGPDAPLYWIDFGNGRDTGQVILSTVHAVKQPTSQKFLGIPVLPSVTEEFRGLLDRAQDQEEPSCSLAASRERQDLFINRALAQLGGRLINTLFRQLMIENRGFFLNLADFNARPLQIEAL